MTRLAALVAGLSAAACQTSAQTQETPAALDPDRMDEVAALVAEAVGKASVELGVSSDPGRVVILPPPPGPYEDRSPAMPRTFQAVLRDDTCLLVQTDGELEVELPQGVCLPL
ncbi:hypothetical protein [Parvularcula maris]|uniref:Lipoprotein n=1 Tax=Parvularcula maris TaxID=2965077 RepID=A0A9X2L833_9PROT|nr:hypothetical protein [Parvularcula maris]MCQ8184691.1 hypothetical protein [Parvularcula maris]